MGVLADLTYLCQTRRSIFVITDSRWVNSMMTHQKKRFFTKIFWVAVGFTVGLILGPISESIAEGDFKPAVSREPKDEFDRLDGTGPSRKKVDFIDWWSQEKQYEVHVKPKGSLVGVNFEIDREDKKKDPVIIIEYKLQGVPYTIVRRHTLSSSGLNNGFRVYEDTTTDDYDKLILTNNTLTSNVRQWQYGKPRQKFPDHHKALGGEDEAVAETKSYNKTVPTQETVRFQKVDHDTRQPAKTPVIDEIDADGGIRPYEF